VSNETRTPALAEQPLEPVPVEGCDVCGALAQQREAARRTDSPITVRQCSQELANHPHRKPDQG
jgi:hypothetical protein